MTFVFTVGTHMTCSLHPLLAAYATRIVTVRYTAGPLTPPLGRGVSNGRTMSRTKLSLLRIAVAPSQPKVTCTHDDVVHPLDENTLII